MLRSSRLRRRLYERSEVFVRRFEVGVYAGMCFGLALVFLGVVVLAD